MRFTIAHTALLGAAMAAAGGVVLGGMLHGSWDEASKREGPSILFPTAVAAERVLPDQTAKTTDEPTSDPDPMATWGGSVPANPEPVTRLDAARYDAMVAPRPGQGADAAPDPAIAPVDPAPAVDDATP
jgi:hypothetical protein